MILCIAARFAAEVHAAESRPNFVLIYGEGQGWTSTSVQMDDRVPNSKSDTFYTPNLERLAAAGMRFSNFYAASPRCTPSRAAIFTGKSPAQLHMTFISRSSSAATRVVTPDSSTELPIEETTIAELLKPLGYATAHFGKWHVGRTHPSRHGFDESDGPTSNGGPDNVDNPNPKQAYATTKRGIDFMTRQVAAGKPFYLQISQYGGRGVEDAMPQTVQMLRQRGGISNERDLGAAAVALDVDINIGKVLDAIDRLGIAERTYVVYTTDHGTPGRSSNEPLNKGKGTVWEGGIRVPMFVRGPRIKAGSISYVRGSSSDLYPTFAQLAGVSALPKGVEGGSLASVLTGRGESVKRPREEFVVHFPHYDMDDVGPASAILLGNYKLIRIYETDTRLLFDLSKDMAERNDLSKQMPEKVRELDDQLSQYLAAVGAQMPTINEDIAPGTRPADRRRGGNRRNRDRNRDRNNADARSGNR